MVLILCCFLFFQKHSNGICSCVYCKLPNKVLIPVAHLKLCSHTMAHARQSHPCTGVQGRSESSLPLPSTMQVLPLGQERNIKLTGSRKRIIHLSVVSLMGVTLN